MFLWPKYASVCYMFLGDPPDTVEEGVTSLHILNLMEKIFCKLWAPEQQLLNTDGYRLFLLLLSQHGLVMGADYRDSMFVRIYSGIFLYKAGREKPQYFVIVLRKKILKIFKTRSIYRTHWLYLQACQGVQDHLYLPVTAIILQMNHYKLFVGIF